MQAQDISIPLLTEVISDNASVLIEPFSLKDPDQLSSAVLPATTTLSPQDWGHVEQEIREKILRQLQDHIDTVIAQHVREGLNDVLQTVIKSVGEHVKTGLHQTLHELISDAVVVELNNKSLSTAEWSEPRFGS